MNEEALGCDGFFHDPDMLTFDQGPLLGLFDALAYYKV